jgi:3-oxoacyl-[acyl-carrier protein] reductase
VSAGAAERHVVLITGGTRGIGLAVAEAFAVRGDHVIVTGGSDASAAHGAQEALRRRCPDAEARLLDCRDGAATRALIDELLERHGRLDAAVANAGVIRPRPFLEIDEEQWRELLDVHLTGSFLLLQAAARAMVATGRGGSLVSVTAPAALRGGVGVADYASAKGGIVSLTKCMARELAPHGITVNSVLPVAESRMTEALREFHGIDRDSWQQGYPQGRMPTPEEVADVFVFLASDAARHVNGQVLAVDAGRSM